MTSAECNSAVPASPGKAKRSRRIQEPPPPQPEIVIGLEEPIAMPRQEHPAVNATAAPRATTRVDAAASSAGREGGT